MHIPNGTLLSLLLSHSDFSHFKQIANDDWRDSSKTNPSFSLSSKGWKDHKTGEGGSLFDLAKERNLLQKESIPSPSNTSKNTSETAKLIWNNSKKNDAVLRSYFSDQRAIPFEQYSDLIESGIFLVNEYNGQKSIVMKCDSFSDKFVINRILLNDDCSKKDKRFLGGSGTLVLPAFNGQETKNFIVIEGIENALSLRNLFEEFAFIVSNTKNNFHLAKNLLDHDSSVLILSDHDANETETENGQYYAERLLHSLIDSGINAKAMMPSQQNYDANMALLNDDIDRWISSLRDFQVVEKTIGEEPQKEAKLIEFPKDVFPSEIESYLEKVSGSLNLTYSASASAFLACLSTASGSYYQTKISKTWNGKPCLWVSFVGDSGMGKTPLLNLTGFAFLSNWEAEQRREFAQYKEAYQQSLKAWEDSQKSDDSGKLELVKNDDGQATSLKFNRTIPKPCFPKAPRLATNKATLETLMKRHSEHSFGFSFYADELRGFLKSLDQYNRGDSKQMMMVLKTATSPIVVDVMEKRGSEDGERLIEQPHACLVGGIQPAFLQEILTKESQEDGFASRFLHCILENRKSFMSEQERESFSNSIAQREIDAFRNVLIRFLNERLNYYPTPENSFNPPKPELILFELEPEAKATLQEYGNHLLKRELELPEATGKALLKLRGDVVGIITILHRIEIMRNHWSEQTAPSVSVETVEKAIKVCQYFESTLENVYGQVFKTEEDKRLEKVLSTIRKFENKAKPEQVKDKLKGTFSTKKETGEYLKTLIDKKIIIEIKEGNHKFLSVP
jgi:hypothetical protein